MEETQIVVDLEAYPLLESMQRALGTLRGNTNRANNFTIFRTPRNISYGMKNLFHPSVISIGPFHRGHYDLQALEEQKWRVLLNFLSRENHISLDLCVSEMRLLEERTRMCYSEAINYASDEFVQMMLLDGCFVLEYFLQLYGPKSNSIIDVGSSSRLVYFNFLLLENQIPFFIVEKLYDLTGSNEDARMSFVNDLVHFVTRGLTIQSNYFDIPYEPPAEIHHLVHLFYHYLVHNIDKPVVLSSKSFDRTRMFSTNRIKGLPLWFLSWVLPRNFPSSTSQSLSYIIPSSWKKSSFIIPSATELTMKGLKLKKKSNPKYMLDISFEYGVLKIPTLAISAATKPLFANLIAFENSNHGKEDLPFTSFVTFLDNLINTPNDVAILQKCGIVENWLGSEEELTSFINQVTEIGSVGENHYLADLFMEVNKYIESHWIKSSLKRQRAKLIHEYFSSPWKAISLFAALILLVLTCVQTFYAVYAYKFPPSS